jgi:hypothetical protein
MKVQTILMTLAVLMIGTFAIAGVVTYLSNSISATATVSSPIELTATAVNALGEPVDLDAITAYGGETISIGTNTKNLSNVAQTCDLTMTGTPSIATTEGELTTKVVKTISLEANAEQADVTTITFDPAITPGEYAIQMICNVTPAD